MRDGLGTGARYLDAVSAAAEVPGLCRPPVDDWSYCRGGGVGHKRIARWGITGITGITGAPWSKSLKVASLTSHPHRRAGTGSRYSVCTKPMTRYRRHTRSRDSIQAFHRYRHPPAWTTAQLPRDAGHHRTGAPNRAPGRGARDPTAGLGLEAPNQGKRAYRCGFCAVVCCTNEYCAVPCALSSACRGTPTPTPHRGGRTLVAGRAQRREEHQSQHQRFQVPLETGFRPKDSSGFPSSVKLRQVCNPTPGTKPSKGLGKTGILLCAQESRRLEPSKLRARTSTVQSRLLILRGQMSPEDLLLRYANLVPGTGTPSPGRARNWRWVISVQAQNWWGFALGCGRS